MKKTALFLCAVSWMLSTLCAQTRIPTFELHFSANHPLENASTDRTFYGGGLGANLVFMDQRPLSLKTGLEANFFHTWNRSSYSGKMSSKSNVHYHFWNISIPLMLRLHIGKKVKFFLEAGTYLGIPVAGNSTFKYNSHGMYPGSAIINEVRTEKFEGYFSVSPAASVGVILPVSQRLDLYLKPEFVFQKNFNVNDVYGPGGDFNEKFRYIRLCLGLRINLNDEIE